MSRPTAIVRGSNCSTYARPIAVRALLVQLAAVQPADVVRLEDLRIEHGADLDRRTTVARVRGVAHGASPLQFEGGTEARDGPLRRPRRLDGARLRQRSGGRAAPRDAVLRRRLPLRDPARRDRREVRRRRRAWRRSASPRRTRTTPSAPSAPRSRSSTRSRSSASRRGSGIESGEVVADDADSTFATGEAVNVAARLQQSAAPGRDPDRPVGAPPDARPRRARIAARSTCAGRRAHPGVAPRRRVRPSAAAAPTSRPLVGREAELELLENTFARAARDAPRAPLHDLRRAGRGQEPPGARVRRRARGRDDPRAAAPRRTARASRTGRSPRWSSRGRDLPTTTRVQEASRSCAPLRATKPSPTCSVSPSGVLDAGRGRAQRPGDRLGGPRVGRCARRGAAACPGLRGHPLGRGAAARADRASCRPGSATRRC